jgi:predicted DNA-binding transcriptional regulator YafY
MQGGSTDHVTSTLLLEATRAKERLEAQVKTMREDIDTLLACTLPRRLKHSDAYRDIKRKYHKDTTDAKG